MLIGLERDALLDLRRTILKILYTVYMGEQGLYCVKRCIVRPVNASPFHLLLSTYHHLYFGLEIQYNALHDRSVLRADVHTQGEDLNKQRATVRIAIR